MGVWRRIGCGCFCEEDFPFIFCVADWPQRRGDGDAVFAVQKKLIADKLAAANAAIIARDGRVVYHRAAESGLAYDRPITDDTVFPIWSMSKPITSVAAMILFDRGAFKLDDPVADALPELAKVRVKADDGKTKPLARPITYRDLLRHTSGFYGYDGAYNEDGFWARTVKAKGLAKIIGELAREPIEHQPGAKYTYGMSTAVMGRAIEMLSGRQPRVVSATDRFRKRQTPRRQTGGGRTAV